MIPTFKLLRHFSVGLATRVRTDTKSTFHIFKSCRYINHAKERKRFLEFSKRNKDTDREYKKGRAVIVKSF